MATYFPLLLLFLVGALLVGALVALSVLVGVRKEPNPLKPVPFECGNPSEGAHKIRPSVKYYLTALLFVVFAIEVVMIVPWAVELRSLGWVAMATMATFIGLLAVALIYVWRKGALEWER